MSPEPQPGSCPHAGIHAPTRPARGGGDRPDSREHQKLDRFLRIVDFDDRFGVLHVFEHGSGAEHGLRDWLRGDSIFRFADV